MSGSIRRITAANIDGRANSPRYVQNQLTDLHDVLVASAAELKSAIRSDSSSSAVAIEADVEYYAAINVVKERYAQFDFEKSVKDEYRVARGEDYEGRRIAAGIVYIVPASHTLLFSVVSPLSAAIAAGNCVVVELENSLSETASVLRRLLAKTLDNDTFTIVDTRSDESFLQTCAVVQGRAESQDIPFSISLTSPASARVIALVDRTANFEEAAKAIVRARTAFAGKSPYAPDLVLVNEFMMEQFTNAVVTNFTKYLSSSVAVNGHAGMNGSAGKTTRRKDVSRGLSEKELNDDGVTVILSGGSGTVVSVRDRSSPILQKKYSDVTLILHSITSLDDAIDLANTSTDPLLTTYHFAAPAVAKYTSQFITSRSHFINHIPTSLLLGPSAPTSFPISTTARYTPEMFTLPCPLLSTISKEAQVWEGALGSGSAYGSGQGKVEEKAAEEWKRNMEARSREPLKPTGQREGKMVGFFDQGLITGVSLVLLPVLAGVGVGVWYGGRIALRRWR